MCVCRRLPCPRWVVVAVWRKGDISPRLRAPARRLREVSLFSRGQGRGRAWRRGYVSTFRGDTGCDRWGDVWTSRGDQPFAGRIAKWADVWLGRLAAWRSCDQLIARPGLLGDLLSNARSRVVQGRGCSLSSSTPRVIRLQLHKGREFVQSVAEPTSVHSVPLGLSDDQGVLELLLRFCPPPRKLEGQRQR